MAQLDTSFSFSFSSSGLKRFEDEDENENENDVLPMFPHRFQTPRPVFDRCDDCCYWVAILAEVRTLPGMRASEAEKRITVYCASSRKCAKEYHDAAWRLGETLADAKYAIVYGGGAVGSMGAVADGALARGGRVIGILPRFMQELEWGHKQLSELVLVENMRVRKERMLLESDGVVALPGGCGTLEELLEVITLKRLGLFLQPIILVNTRRFFDPLQQLLASAVSERFMDERHQAMWQIVSEPEEVPAALSAAPKWSSEARGFAAL